MSRGKSAYVLISAIRRGGGTQIRAALDEATVSDYAAVLAAGGKLPEVRVMYDGKEHWLIDGFHRVEAALRNGQARMMAAVESGDRRKAILAACGANADHGLPRSNADKRRAVMVHLEDPEWREWSDRAIAKSAKVDHKTVATLRAEVGNSPLETRKPAKSLATDSVKNQIPNAEARDVASNEFATPLTAVRESAADPAPNGGETHRGLAGVPVDAGAQAGDSSASPPNTAPCVDMHGLSARAEWVLLANDVAAAIDAFDGHLRAAQADLAGLLKDPGVGAAVQRLRKEAHDLAARARDGVRPVSACLYCKDPDGRAGRRDECNGCHGLGWLTEEQHNAIPGELRATGEHAKVIDQKRGGFVALAEVLPGFMGIDRSVAPRAKPVIDVRESPRRLRIQDDAGRELVTERDEDEDATGWG